jgi:hypothetical protein
MKHGLMQTAIINYHILGSLQKKLFLTVLKVQVQETLTHQVLVRAFFWIIDCLVLVVSLHRGRRPESSGVPFINMLIPFMRATPS